MRRKAKSARAKRSEQGYALLLVVFLTTLILIGTMSIGLRVLTEGRRQREAEMIWRGKQYTRGIKLYYRKFGRFPTSMDNLIKPQTGNIRFMRQQYTDPMNKADGTWRMIYVGPAGQLIGSLKPQPNLMMPSAPGQIGAASTSPGGLFSSSGNATIGTGPTTPAPGVFGAGVGSGTTGTSTGLGTGAVGTDSTATGGAGTDSQPAPMVETPTIVGGNIIGVGSKINQPSIMVYEKATNYRLFEFIWDPSKDMVVVGSSGPGIGTPIGTPGGTPGQIPPGMAPNPINPQPPQTPPLANPNPNPNQQPQ